MLTYTHSFIKKSALTTLGMIKSQPNLHNTRAITLKRVASAGPISVAHRLGYTTPKKRRSGDELLATLCRGDRPGNRTPDLSHRELVRLTTKPTAGY